MTDEEITRAKLLMAIAIRDNSMFQRAHEGHGVSDIMLCLGGVRCPDVDGPRTCPFCMRLGPSFVVEDVADAVRRSRRGH